MEVRTGPRRALWRRSGKSGKSRPVRKPITLLFLAVLVPGAASAQTHDLPYAQSGVALDYAEMEARVLYASVTAKQFDVPFTRNMLEQLGLGLAEAKRNLDRAEALLPESLEGRANAIRGVRDLVVAAETQLEKLRDFIVEQTKHLSAEEPDDEDEDEEKPQTDWKQIERQTAWLSADIDAAKAALGKLRGPLGVKPLKKVAKPRGAREAL